MPKLPGEWVFKKLLICLVILNKFQMKRCLEIGMLPESEFLPSGNVNKRGFLFRSSDVQNKRNKREYYFVDALNNAIQQQQNGGTAAATAAILNQHQTQQQETGVGEGGQPQQTQLVSSLGGIVGAGLDDGQPKQQLHHHSSLSIKSEIDKLLGPSPLNTVHNMANATHQHGQTTAGAPLQLNPVEKFEPGTESESPLGNGARNPSVGGSGQQQQIAGQLLQFQATPPQQQQQHSLPPPPPHHLSPAVLIGGLNPLAASNIDFAGHQLRAAEMLRKNPNEGQQIIYSTPTTGIINQQQQHQQQSMIAAQFPWGVANTLREI